MILTSGYKTMPGVAAGQSHKCVILFLKRERLDEMILKREKAQIAIPSKKSDTG